MAPQEKDIVLAIHEDARMQLKPLVAKFKTTFTEKADKDVFMAIVKRVAKFVQEGEDRFVRLNDSTLDQYGLHAPGAGGGEGGGGGGEGGDGGSGVGGSGGDGGDAAGEGDGCGGEGAGVLGSSCGVVEPGCSGTAARRP